VDLSQAFLCEFQKKPWQHFAQGAAVKNKMDGVIERHHAKSSTGEVDPPAQIPRSVKILNALLVP
jgi:hypothetical protein